nr:uncharacterized mitochondrial protein AtMg00860-like [Rhipicephalus microplus]
MEAVLKDIPGTQVFLDDILVAECQHEFGTTLWKVLSTLRDNGIKLREKKCIFGEEGVNYLGHRIDREGLHLCEKKTEAIMKTLELCSVQKLRSFLGLISYF